MQARGQGQTLARWAVGIAIAQLVAGMALAHFGPVPIPLTGVPIPEVPGLSDGPDPIVVDKDQAIALGKALFWDTNVGSDGIACASCHFHAGADSRVKNQLTPSGPAVVPDPDFELSSGGEPLGPNYTLKQSDFPLYQTPDPLAPLTPQQEPTYSSNDVVSSSGTFGGDFQAVSSEGDGIDSCDRALDPVFHVGSVGVRRVEPRNTPTVINSVFTHRNFWDGSASNVFNGSSKWGDRDPDAGVWVMTDPDTVEKQRLELVNSSLASQAMAPPLSDVEMGCAQRTWANLGRKLSCRRPLENQQVHWEDSVLGPLARSSPDTLEKGLATSYYEMVSEAFAPRFWAYEGEAGEFGAPGDGGPDYTQYEANFSMFFGLAVQLYQSTLVSDDSPFDRSAQNEAGIPIDLTETAQNGFTQFRIAHCNQCHLGPALTAAALVPNAILVENDPEAFGNQTSSVSTTRNVVTRMAVEGGPGFIDTGYASTGVTPADDDLGAGGSDAFGNPLSFADQYLQLLAGNAEGVVDRYVDEIRACDLDLPIAADPDAGAPPRPFFTAADGIVAQPQDTEGCYIPNGAFVPEEQVAAAELADPADPDNSRMLSMMRGAFKIPTLRNVELTGPYMHNGSMATLEEVIEFYTRGGNFDPDAKQFETVFPQVQLRFDAQARADIIEFLHTLTDERVRYERAPFDHPELWIPHGHSGDHESADAGNPIDDPLGVDEFLRLPAVGANGLEQPILSYESYLEPCDGACPDRLALGEPGPPVPLGMDAPEVCMVPEPSAPWPAALAALSLLAGWRRRESARNPSGPAMRD